jgi:hypothetical protein
MCWNSLKQIPPKEYATIEEIEKVSDILDLFRDSISDFVKLIEEGEQLQKDIQSKRFTTEQITKKRGDFQTKSNILEDKKGKALIEVEFEDAVFNTFFQLFEKWGKNWFREIGSFIAFRKELNATNQQAKGK